eukprot:COSAG02_NODE_6983_length_3248_cov_209.588441_6_plen_174_part_00
MPPASALRASVTVYYRARSSPYQVCTDTLAVRHFRRANFANTHCAPVAALPTHIPGRPQARATGAGGRGWLPLPRPPQSPHGCLSGLRGLGAHYLQYPFAQAQLSNPQAARAAPPPTAPPSPARAALCTIETFRRLLIDSKMRAVGRILGGGAYYCSLHSIERERSTAHCISV